MKTLGMNGRLSGSTHMIGLVFVFGQNSIFDHFGQKSFKVLLVFLINLKQLAQATGGDFFVGRGTDVFVDLSFGRQ
jgi:hypothetical protein